MAETDNQAVGTPEEYETDVSRLAPELHARNTIAPTTSSTPTSSIQSTSESVTIVSTTPQVPSITAAIRRGSFYGDAAPKTSVVEVLSSILVVGPSQTSETGSSLAETESTEVASEIGEERLSDPARLYILGFLRGILQRLELLLLLPGATSKQDTSLNLAEVPDGLPELAMKTKLLKSADLIKYSLGVPSKFSKFSIETGYLIQVLTSTLREVETLGTFHQLTTLIEEDAMRIQRLPDSIEHIKKLKEEMAILKVMTEAEVQDHKEKMHQWAKNIVQQKLELKELRKQNMIGYRYKADTTLARGDLARRDYEVRLVGLKVENIQLKNDIEVEKKVHDESVEFLKRQNMELREEAVTLQAKIEIETHNLDQMLEKMKLRKKEKEDILAELEPRYMARMAEIEAERVEALRKQEEFFLNQGKIELETFAALKIQKVWRGYLVRKVWQKVLRKTKRKRGGKKRKAKKGKKKK